MLKLSQSTLIKKEDLSFRSWGLIAIRSVEVQLDWEDPVAFLSAHLWNANDIYYLKNAT